MVNQSSTPLDRAHAALDRLERAIARRDQQAQRDAALRDQVAAIVRDLDKMIDSAPLAAAEKAD